MKHSKKQSAPKTPKSATARKQKLEEVIRFDGLYQNTLFRDFAGQFYLAHTYRGVLEPGEKPERCTVREAAKWFADRETIAGGWQGWSSEIIKALLASQK